MVFADLGLASEKLPVEPGPVGTAVRQWRLSQYVNPKAEIVSS